MTGVGLRCTPPALGQRMLRLESSQRLPSGHVVTEYALADASSGDDRSS